MILLCLGCGDRGGSGPVSVGSVRDGFSVDMPHEPDRQSATLDLHGHDVEMRINLIGDAGVMYGVTFFDIPPALVALPAQERLDTLWHFFAQRTVGKEIDGPGPLGEDSPGMRNAWFLEEEGSRMAAVLRVEEEKGVMALASSPDQFQSPASDEKMIGYLKSLKLEN